MSTYLDAILAHHRARAEHDDRLVSSLARLAAKCPPPRDFEGALRACRPGRMVAPIAEIKRRSPVRGEFDTALEPKEVAADYEKGGAAAISVLTDSLHFGGSAEDLVTARSAVDLPVLRKDFTISLHDVYDARIMGADAILLIVAALSDEELTRLASTADELGLGALVEVHDEREVERAVRFGARIIGVNQRDLHSFAVDTTRALRVGEDIPSSIVRVAESGIRTHEDVALLSEAGFHAVLVGEALVTAPDRKRAMSDLFFSIPSTSS